MWWAVVIRRTWLLVIVRDRSCCLVLEYDASFATLIGLRCFSSCLDVNGMFVVISVSVHVFYTL